MRDEISYRRFCSMGNSAGLITGYVSQLTAASRRPCLPRPVKGRDVNQSRTASRLHRPYIKLPRGASLGDGMIRALVFEQNRTRSYARFLTSECSMYLKIHN